MVWEDRTLFDAIQEQFGLIEKEVIQLPKHEMRLKNWKKWRARVQGQKTKHRKLRSDDTLRFLGRIIAGLVVFRALVLERIDREFAVAFERLLRSCFGEAAGA